MTSNEPKTYPVPASALAAVKRFRDIYDAAKAEQERLQDEYVSRCDEAAKKANAALREEWNQIAASVGMDPAESWEYPGISLVHRYIDYGFAALEFTPITEETIAVDMSEIFEEGEDDEEDPEYDPVTSLPDGSKIN